MSEGILKGGLLFKVSAELTKVSAELIPMVFVQGGTFTMGCTSEQGSDCGSDEKPAHKVTVSDFYIGKYPVTQAQWKAVMGSYPKELHNTGCDDCPVDNVSWDDAQGFIKKLNAQTGKTYRLPTEAEWEYAARGGAQTKGYKYSGSNNIGEVAWYDGNYKNSKHGTQGTTHPVGTKKPNELGIYDMSGNVWEWCSDWYGSYSSNAETNPKGPNTGSDRVSRGGSWIINALSVLSVTGRSSAGPGSRRNFLGFRVVLP
ncbi:MAG: formylglycine-generating enzyme family protein [Bacteroidales bacterium]|nr:formylglycine-generating enzyme family protein [Bacteroidales bacterium]